MNLDHRQQSGNADGYHNFLRACVRPASRAELERAVELERRYPPREARHVGTARRNLARWTATPCAYYQLVRGAARRAQTSAPRVARRVPRRAHRTASSRVALDTGGDGPPPPRPRRATTRAREGVPS